MTTFLILLLMCSVAVSFTVDYDDEFSFEDGTKLRFSLGETINDLPGGDKDFLEHDCQTIKDYTKENVEAEPWFQKGRKFQKKDTYVKYNHAYGLLIIGNTTFSRESMMRACYLMRYIFADNEHMRRMAYRNGFFVHGWRGGRCCPPQMANQGLSCMCEDHFASGKKNNFPFTGKGAPAHEMAHYFIPHFLASMVKEGKLELPKFINNADWSYKKPYAKGACKNAVKMSTKYGALFDFLWNSQMQDMLRDPPSTKIKFCDWHHYFIYTGQQHWLFMGNKEHRTLKQKQFKQRNPNLYNLMAKIWPCNNKYIAVCKDASYGFTAGLAQTFLIGKADPVDGRKMRCKNGLDDGEIKRSQMKPLHEAKDDISSIKKCHKLAIQIDPSLKNKSFDKLPVDAFKRYLRDGNEEAWYLKRCCAKTGKFASAMEKY